MASEVARTHHTHTTDRDADAGGHLIDDFASGTARARWGTTWRAFSDRLLGGGSDVELAFGEHQGRRCMLVQGRLRPRESPTFVQAALPLGRGGRGFDAREHAGFELVACGVPGTYFLHVREQGCSMPWQHYRAAFELEAHWKRFVLPFTALEPVGARRALDRSQLGRIGIVARPPLRTPRITVAALGFMAAGNDPGA